VFSSHIRRRLLTSHLASHYFTKSLGAEQMGSGNLSSAEQPKHQYLGSVEHPILRRTKVNSVISRVGKLQWFPMVLVPVGGCLALRNASCVHRLAGGGMLFWYILERKSLFLLRAKERAPERSQHTRTVPTPKELPITRAPMVCHGSSGGWRVFGAP
jgi:hypothetical protein